MRFKNNIRNALAQLFFLTGITTPPRRSFGKLSIVTFHRVLPEAQRQDYPFPGLVVTPEELNEYLTYFTKYFDCGAVSIQHDRYLSGETTARPLLAISFDDAQYDNYINAFPILERHGVIASFFAPVIAIERHELLWHDRLGFALLSLQRQGSSGRENLKQILSNAGLSECGSNNKIEDIVQAFKEFPLVMRLKLVENLVEVSGSAQTPEFARLMSFNELAELGKNGHEIGSHSMTHCLMPECDDNALIYELAESRRILQMHVGQSIDTFCYPNGNCDSRTAVAVATAGYSRAVTTTWGSNVHDADPFQLRRFDMNAKHIQDTKGKFMPPILAFRMSGFYPGQW